MYYILFDTYVECERMFVHVFYFCRLYSSLTHSPSPFRLHCCRMLLCLLTYPKKTNSVVRFVFFFATFTIIQYQWMEIRTLHGTSFEAIAFFICSICLYFFFFMSVLLSSIPSSSFSLLCYYLNENNAIEL